MPQADRRQMVAKSSSFEEGVFYYKNSCKSINFQLQGITQKSQMG